MLVDKILGQLGPVCAVVELSAGWPRLLHVVLWHSGSDSFRRGVEVQAGSGILFGRVGVAVGLAMCLRSSGLRSVACAVCWVNADCLFELCHADPGNPASDLMQSLPKRSFVAVGVAACLCV